MKIRKAKIEDLQSIQNLNNQLFELEIENFDKYLIRNWPLSKAGKEYFFESAELAEDFFSSLKNTSKNSE